MSEKLAGKRSGNVQAVIDVLIAVSLVASIFLTMFGFSGNWPPLVVIESKSMQHSESESYIGTMDTGDLVMIQKVERLSDIKTYLEGERTDYSIYGAFGDVVIYWREGDKSLTPIIHRPVLYLLANDDQSFSAPEIRNLTQGVDFDFLDGGDSWDHLQHDIIIHHYGHRDADLDIPIELIIGFMQTRGMPLHDGFVTKGDYNSEVDQRLGIMKTREPVPFDWIAGRAVGEIPWVGIVKLWSTNSMPDDTPSNSVSSLLICIGVVFAVPVMSEIYIWRRGKGGDPSEREIEPGEKKG